MFEKPQYLTPDGYRRSSKNPCKPNQTTEMLKLLEARRAIKKAREQARIAAEGSRTSAKNGTGKISEKAAQLVALAIKGMLNQK